MREQHLSDEAVAAFADDVLRGHARERASRHTARCAECKHAVAVQREAVWALRSAPAPALPSGLLDRLRDVPSTTPIRAVPTSFAADGSAMFATFGSLGAAALAPDVGADEARDDNSERAKGMRPFAMTAAALAMASALGVGGVSYLSVDHKAGTPAPAHTRPAPNDPHIRLAHQLERVRTR